MCPLKGHEHCEDRASVCVRHSGGPYELLLNEPGNPGHVSGNTLVSHREHVMSLRKCGLRAEGLDPRHCTRSKLSEGAPRQCSERPAGPGDEGRTQEENQES